MKFSVIIPTRNRPKLLRIAIESVVIQTFDDFEIIVVNDGSDTEYDKDYQELKNEFGTKIQVLNLERSWNGHGQSYAINMGGMKAKGQYLCFLDDDDFWIEPNHLAIADKILNETAADVYFTNQQAFLNNQRINKKIWLESLYDLFQHQNIQPLENGAFPVNVKQLMGIDGFEHLNTTIADKKLFNKINGMDENIRYECDRDFYNRLIDNANNILFNPIETSRHNIPDPNKSNNMSTLVSDLEKKLYRLYLLDKAVLFSNNSEIMQMAKQHKNYALKHITEILYKEKNYKLASFYAKEVLLNGFNFKWLAFAIYLQIKSLFA